MTEKRNFADWLSKFRSSIANYGYYIDFDKVYRNVTDIKVELNILNSLIGSRNIEDEFKSILAKYPETLKCIPILLAVRANEIYAIDGDGEFTYDFKKANHTTDEYVVFMRKTGLFDLLQKHIVSNLVDYVTGVETGLDSNGRKNQRFNFVIKTDKAIYGIETNFYASGGSKLNETARSYKQIAQEVATIDCFEFVWFTDGQGWMDARHNLEETFDVMEHIYSIDDLENDIIEELY